MFVFFYSHLNADVSVSVYKMPDPDRGQGVLNFSQQNRRNDDDDDDE